MFCKKDMKTNLKRYNCAIRNFLAYWILHIRTILSFPKLILLLIYMQVCHERQDETDVGLHAILLLRAISISVVILYILRCIKDVDTLISRIIILGSDMSSTNCQLDLIFDYVIMVHCLFYSLLFCGVTTRLMWVCTPYCVCICFHFRFIAQFMFSLELRMDLGCMY